MKECLNIDKQAIQFSIQISSRTRSPFFLIDKYFKSLYDKGLKQNNHTYLAGVQNK